MGAYGNGGEPPSRGGQEPTQDRLEWLSENWNRRRPDIDIRPWRVWGRVTRVNELFLAAIAPALQRNQLTFKEYQTLGALVLLGPPYEANPATIARFNLLTSGGMTNLLGRMEREGYVERRPDPDDRRGVIVRLTEEGLRHFDQAVMDENKVEHALLANFSEEERDILAMLLRKLLLSLESDRTRTPGES